ncbi:MAG TPA: DNA repair and recombination protein RadA [Nitrososphaerales archaeon]|nr:DNA repair and recombination protein RadA [Nitrososphaerales archaeon]
MSEAIEVDIGDLPGVGPATRAKLESGGITTILDLAASTTNELVDSLNLTEETAHNLVFEAQKLLKEKGYLEKDLVSANELFARRAKMLRCTTYSQNLDNLLIGGIETQAVTEFYGEFGSGKTQICHTVCVSAQLPVDQHGLGGSALYIDTESTFRPERVAQIAKARDLDVENILNNIHVAKIYNASHLELIVRAMGSLIQQNNIKLVIVDSIISLHRAEFLGRGSLSERQQKLNAIMHRLKRVAEIYNVAVIITNQVQATPDTFFGDPTKAAGGNIIGHASTYRIYLRKAGQERKAIMIDSPMHPYGDTNFMVVEAGITDPMDKKPAKVFKSPSRHQEKDREDEEE